MVITDMFIDFDDLPKEIETFFFSAGEPHVKLPQITSKEIFIKASINSFEDFGLLVMFLNALSWQKPTDIYLYLPYFPGSRQDRTDDKSPFSVDVYAAMLAASLTMYNGRLKVYTFDMHSERGSHVVNDALAWGLRRDTEITNFFDNITVSRLDGSYFDEDINYIIAPDTGAIDRAMVFRDTFFPKVDVISCKKEREFSTGRLLSYDINLPSNVLPGKFLVVDDICDGGGTFKLLAEAFKKHQISQRSELQLYVSHGIFSRTPEALEDSYSKIYTTDSFPHPFYETDFPFIVEMPVPFPDKFKYCKKDD